jgi:putative nucleotidyltransferase with HDIG domain
MVNSAFFRRGRRITSIDQAVSYLGLSAVRALVLSAEIFELWSTKATTLDLERLQQHCHVTMGVAHTLTAGTPLADDALLAALLHDIGYWVLVHERPRELEQARVRAVERAIPMHESERQTIGASHAEIGAYLLGIWGLPYRIVEAVAHHHTPERVRQKEFDVLAALAVAHALSGTDDATAFQGAVPPDPGVGPAYLEALGAPFNWDEAVQRTASSVQS